MLLQVNTVAVGLRCRTWWGKSGSKFGWDGITISTETESAPAAEDNILGPVERYLAESLLSLQESKKFVKDEGIRIGW